MSEPTLTGSSSLFPYRVDAFEVPSNYLSSSPGLSGDVVTSSLRNRLADSVIAIETELAGVPTSDSGELRMSCVTKSFSSVQFNSVLTVSVPAEVTNYLCPDGLTIQASDAVYQFSIRPTSPAAGWSAPTVSNYRAALHLQHWLVDNNVLFSLKDPNGILSTALNYNAGNIIASVILFRQLT